MGQQVRSASKSYLWEKKKKKKRERKGKRNQSGDSPNYLCLPRCYVSAPAEHSPETPSFPSADAAPVPGFLRAVQLNYGVMGELLYEVKS